MAEPLPLRRVRGPVPEGAHRPGPAAAPAPPQLAEQLVSLKTEHPALSVSALIKTARERGIDHPLAPSTVHRLLSREGLLDKHPGEPVATDRRRFAFRYAGECWQSDVMHGPKVRDGRTRRKTYLIAFIDDATRAIPFAAFAFSENTTAFLPMFNNALILTPSTVIIAITAITMGGVAPNRRRIGFPTNGEQCEKSTRRRSEIIREIRYGTT